MDSAFAKSSLAATGHGTVVSDSFGTRVRRVCITQDKITALL